MFIAVLKFVQKNHWKVLYKTILYVQVSRKSGIRLLPDIRYPAFRIAGYPAGWISGKFNIRHILTENNPVCESKPEIRYPAVAGYPAEYPVSGF